MSINSLFKAVDKVLSSPTGKIWSEGSEKSCVVPAVLLSCCTVVLSAPPGCLQVLSASDMHGLLNKCVMLSGIITQLT